MSSRQVYSWTSPT